MFAKTLIAGFLTTGFLLIPFAVDAEAGPGRAKIKQSQSSATYQPGPNAQLSSDQSNPQAGSMDGWPQNLDELANAYNCGPYADKESSKKCKD
jgi:hypothetical protein